MNGNSFVSQGRDKNNVVTTKVKNKGRIEIIEPKVIQMFDQEYQQLDNMFVRSIISSSYSEA